jgi:hypothetical protein
MLERIQRIQEKIKERENKIRRNRLISYSNQINKDLFEKDEYINRATQLMWSKEFEEAINEGCKVWTSIMIIDKQEAIFAKVKVLQIMIESTLNLVMSNTKEAEDWLETLNKIDNKGIMTVILNIKMKIRLQENKEEICEEIIDTL